ncbi:hypothetical protein [Primorskyibacter sp. S187A]|uniref:hypothetical protein n=1 Tax=Primorskyibacter sp. S187A TaxID=3415130 RepID=UPI003C7B0798
MTSELWLLHTADVHVDTFDTLRDARFPDARISHAVHAEWLARAQSDGITPELQSEISGVIHSAPGKVLCTCSTLGPVAEENGAMRIDRPMMRAAAQAAEPILLVCALQSTAEASLALLHEELDLADVDPLVLPIVLQHFWPLFESGDVAGFHAAIAAAVIEIIAARPDIKTVVLAQVSMAPVAHLLDGAGLRVLASPELALGAALNAQARISLGDPITT